MAKAEAHGWALTEDVLIQVLSPVFPLSPLPDLSSFESDSYEPSTCMRAFRSRRWDKIDVAELERRPHCIFYLEGTSLCYYLPGLLLQVAGLPTSQLAFSLNQLLSPSFYADDRLFEERIQCLNELQRKSIAQCLKLLMDDSSKRGEESEWACYREYWTTILDPSDKTLSVAAAFRALQRRSIEEFG